MGLAAIGAPDVIPGPRLFAPGRWRRPVWPTWASGWVANDLASAVPFRVLTGVAQAAVYPVAMKLVAGWFRRDRGLAIGVDQRRPDRRSRAALPVPGDRRRTPASTGARWSSRPASPRVAGALHRRVRRAERSARGRRPALLAGDRRAPRSVSRRSGSHDRLLRAHVGAVRDVDVDPDLPDRQLGRRRRERPGARQPDRVRRRRCGCRRIASSPARSRTVWGARRRRSRPWRCPGTCAVIAGILFGAPVPVIVLVGIVWGVSVIADSAQFSSAVSELAPPGTAGSALVGPDWRPASLDDRSRSSASGCWTRRMRHGVAPGVGSMLALGPVVGIIAMWRLRSDPSATKMASGHR